MNAGRVLTVYDDEGNVKIPGFFGFDDAMLLAAEYNQSLYDANAELSLNDPELLSLMESWAAFSKETKPAECCNFDWNELPVTSGGVYYLDPSMMMGNGEDEWGLTFLPNGKAGMYLQGFAISGGTENPQLAYELLQYMTNSPEIAMFLYGDVYARQSLAGIEVDGCARGSCERAHRLQRHSWKDAQGDRSHLTRQRSSTASAFAVVRRPTSHRAVAHESYAAGRHR